MLLPNTPRRISALTLSLYLLTYVVLLSAYIATLIYLANKAALSAPASPEILSAEAGHVE